MKPEYIDIGAYSYLLPEEKIASHPLPDRDQARLLYWRDNRIFHHIFRDLPGLLPREGSMFFNETRVIPARFFFEKSTGARIEILLLEPVAPSTLMAIALSSLSGTTWRCAIGNLKRWRVGTTLISHGRDFTLNATLIDREAGLVEFNWQPAQLSFAAVVKALGEVPLPPYIKRKADAEDRARYQTIYSHVDGAVAAPTAGLHFSDDVMEEIQKRAIAIDFLTLHVGAGTFMPVKERNAVDHPMHSEQLVIRRKNLQTLLMNKPVIAVGTTSLRTLESIYWFGVKLHHDRNAPLVIESFYPYQSSATLSLKNSCECILDLMDRQKVDELTGQTSIYVLPGYTFKVCDALITNFHQPGSTLLLLIAAFVGSGWKNIYSEALKNNYRFLSYGDSSYLVRDNSLIV